MIDACIVLAIVAAAAITIDVAIHVWSYYRSRRRLRIVSPTRQQPLVSIRIRKGSVR